MKKGQVTIFIIIAVLVFSSTLILIQTSKFIRNTQNLEGSVGNYLQACLETTAEQAVKHSLLQSAFYYNNAAFDATPHFVKLAKPINKTGEKQIEKETFFDFSKENLEVSLTSYIIDNFHSCINKFPDFSKNVEYMGNGTILVEVEENVMVFNLEYPTTIRKSNETILLKDFIYSRKTDVGRIVGIVNQIVDESVENNDVPANTIKNLLDQNSDLSIHLSFLDAEKSIDEIKTGNTSLGTVIYFLTFKENKDIVGFTIEYDWLRLE